jgi:hypothetical protein
VQNTAVLVLVLLDHWGVLGTSTLPVYAAFYIVCLAAEGFMFSAILEMGLMVPIAFMLFDLILGELIDGIVRTIV